MIFNCHEVEFEIPDAWWIEAGMKDFVPESSSYRRNPEEARLEKVFEAKISDIKPFERRLSAGVFNDNVEATARQRVVSILRGFKQGTALGPIRLVELPSGDNFRFRIGEGVHRFYCSIAVGFSHIPAFKGFDFDGDI